MIPRFDYGDAVRVIRNVRNDGTYPGLDMGELLMRRGSVGTVIEIGTFLQDQIIYTVHFLDAGRIVGCREEELIGADEEWTPSRFESREKVRAERDFALLGQIVAGRGSIGEVLKVIREQPGGVHYHVIFGDRVLCVPEASLSALVPETQEAGA
ncbi:nitrogen fixation protein NifZ [Pseudothauera nasutitermitis]|uniref:Nitrogen fixation protein NifZ n=1 Tax=Pseudothauera nasutitermitis TaxID=2565930 RepID=A0A4S4ASN2_9RHOO|nr:nitrogen fixation protein NifZ [Pseudothauera nasutitermitis]THF62857.1 nitrogen fixation protein NifZ [Pseudothauera nasutitermitis]